MLSGGLIMSAPVLVLAQGGVVTVSTGAAKGSIFGITYECAPKVALDTAGNPIKDKDGNTIMKYGECTFEDLVEAVKYVVNWASAFAISFSVVVIVYAGANYMMSGDNPGKRKQANQMLQKVAIGIALIVAAWVIVKLITSALGVSGISTLG